jgi:hypothetical protein
MESFTGDWHGGSDFKNAEMARNPVSQRNNFVDSINSKGPERRECTTTQGLPECTLIDDAAGFSKPIRELQRLWNQHELDERAKSIANVLLAKGDFGNAYQRGLIGRVFKGALKTIPYSPKQLADAINKRLSGKSELRLSVNLESKSETVIDCDDVCAVIATNPPTYPMKRIAYDKLDVRIHSGTSIQDEISVNNRPDPPSPKRRGYE